VKAVVLVGGFGTRLRPLTSDTPKQMLPVVDRPMIEWVVDHLGGYGVDEVVLSLGFRPEAFTSRYPDYRLGDVKLSYAVEPEPLGTAGAIRFAAREAGMTETFIVVNGDVLTDLNIRKLMVKHHQAGAEATIALHRVEDPSRFGVVPIAADGRVEAFVEKPDADDSPSNWINAGTYVFEPSIIERIAPGRKVSIERETFPRMAADGVMFAQQSSSYWIDTGTPVAYIQAQMDILERSALLPQGHAHAAATVHRDAMISSSVIMEGAVIESGAQLERAIIMPNATVRSGALVSHSVIGPGSTIGPGARVEEVSVIGEGVRVPADEQHREARLPDPAL